MPEINTRTADARDVHIGDVVRYDGPASAADHDLRDLLDEHPHPLWAYDPERDDDDEPWALLVTSGPGGGWERRWSWSDLPPVVTLVLRDGQPAPAETSAEAERRQMACPMTHLPEMPCGACGKPVETGERRG